MKADNKFKIPSSSRRSKNLNRRNHGINFKYSNTEDPAKVTESTLKTSKPALSLETLVGWTPEGVKLGSSIHGVEIMMHLGGEN
jgi:hypothetical protein